MKIKRFKNYITWQDNQGNFNTECNRASLLNENDVALTIPTNNITKCAYIYIYNGEYYMRIRKLTPLECLKLQGFSEDDYNAIKDQFSDSAIYHVAGDSISVSVLMGIFGEMTNVDYHKAINNYVDTLVEI